MYASENLRAGNWVPPSTSGESSRRELKGPNSLSIYPQESADRQRGAPPQDSPASSFLRDRPSPVGSDYDDVASDNYEDDISDSLSDGSGDLDSGKKGRGPPVRPLSTYESYRRDDDGDFQPRRPHFSLLPPTNPYNGPAMPVLINPFEPRQLLPSPVQRSKPGRRQKPLNRRPRSPSRHFHFHEPRSQENRSSEAEPYHDYPPHRSYYNPVRERHRRVPSNEWVPPWHDPYNLRRSEDIYDSSLVAGHGNADSREGKSNLRPRLDLPSHTFKNERNRKSFQRHAPVQSVNPDYWHRPTAPLRDHQILMPPHDAERDSFEYRSRRIEIESDESLSENEEAWADLEDIDTQEFPDSSGFVGAGSRMEFRSNVQADEDILNSFAWYENSAVHETVIMANHFNRLAWPDYWRHSDIGTSPKILIDVWSEFRQVNDLVSQIGLEKVFPSIDNSICRSKRRGTLAEVTDAYKAELMPKKADDAPSLPSSTSSSSNDSWDTACKRFQRLLMVRDYLIAVCKDAEYLNELYPTMDAITWFEQAQSVDQNGRSIARDNVVELMVVKISRLAEILKSLNVILQALLWGWGNQSTICIWSDEETAKEEHQRDRNLTSRELKLEHTRRRILTAKHYDNSELRMQTCLHSSALDLSSLADEVEVFAAILSQALSYQCDVLIADDVSSNMVKYGKQEFFGLVFVPRRLQCMGKLIQNRSVWVLEQLPVRPTKQAYISPPCTISPRSDPSYLRTTIVDLARIWGPVWKAPEPQIESPWILYRLPGGYIGSGDIQALAKADEIPTHFSTTLDSSFREYLPDDFSLLSLPYLLIGHGLPRALVVRKSCQTTLERGLDGMALQSVGTLKPFKYKDSSAFHIAVGHAGTQASWTTQIKTNPGILMKRSILDRWKFEPKFRNPRLLLLWYGLEVSLCTRNARRCRLVDVIRSRSMIRYLSETYKLALFHALEADKSNAFIELYDSHPEWQGELGGMIGHCLQVLEGSGVRENGELGVFVFVNKFHDPGQLAMLSKSEHTWISLLKDSSYSAAFAVASYDCLEYPKSPGQKCRLQDHGGQESNSVLQTSYTSTRRVNMNQIFPRIQAQHKLRLADSSKFKVKRRSPKGIILGTWHGGPLRYFQIPWLRKERFRERGQDGESGITVFAVSKRRSRLVQLRKESGPVPVAAGFGAAAQGNLAADDFLRKELNEPTRRARDPLPGDSSWIGEADSKSQKTSPSSTNVTSSSHDDSQTSFELATPEVKVDRQMFWENKALIVDRGTQTDLLIPDAGSAPTIASTPLSDDYPTSSVPLKYTMDSSLSEPNRGSEGEADRKSRHQRHKHSSESHGERRHSHGHRKRRSHGERSHGERSHGERSHKERE